MPPFARSHSCEIVIEERRKRRGLNRGAEGEEKKTGREGLSLSPRSLALRTGR